MMNQKEKILNHIRKNGYITSWDAIQEYRITRISHHIYCLRNEGIDIKTKYFTNPKTKTNYGLYYIKDKDLKRYERLLQNV